MSPLLRSEDMIFKLLQLVQSYAVGIKLHIAQVSHLFSCTCARVKHLSAFLTKFQHVLFPGLFNLLTITDGLQTRVKKEISISLTPRERGSYRKVREISLVGL